MLSSIRNLNSLAKKAGHCRFALRFFYRQIMKRVFRRGITMRLPTGSRMYLPTWSMSGSETYYTGAQLDWGTEELFFKHVDRSGTFVDVGSHIGYYSLYACPIMQKVVAVEPDARAFKALSNNIAPYANIDSVNLAMMEKSGVLKFRGESHEEEMVCEPLDSLPQLGRVTGIKVDVDGNDFSVLLGARKTIETHQSLVITEFLASEINTSDQLFELVDELRYQVFAYCLTGHDTVFRKITRENYSKLHTHMLFLVPAGLVQSFEAETVSD